MISCLLIACQLQLVQLLLVIKFNALPYLFLHVFKRQVPMQLDLSQSVLSLDRDLLFVGGGALGDRLLDNLTALIVFCAVFIPHLLKVSLFLPQLNIKFILNLEDLAFPMFLKVSLVVVNIGPMLLAQLLNPPLQVLLSVILHLSDVSNELLLHRFNLIELIVLYLALLLTNLNLQYNFV